MHIGRITLAAPVALLLAASLSGPAQAAYPGDNGDVAFGGIPAGQAQPEIFAVDPDGGPPRQLTDDPAFDACAAYDATGERIAFCSGRTGAFEIWVMRADGSHERQLTRLGGASTFPDFSPNGRRVVFQFRETLAAGQFDLWTIRDNGRQPRNLTDTPDTDELFAAYSPDGKWIAFIRAELGVPVGQLWIMDRHGRQQRQLTFDLPLKQQLPDWHPDGDLIAYEAGRDIWVIDPDTLVQRRITDTPDVAEYGPAWSPDGERIAYLEFDERRVYTMRADGSDVRPVALELGPQFVPAWQPLPDHGRGHGRGHRD